MHVLVQKSCEMSNKSLVERLKFWRVQRPDEWIMDEFIRDAEKLEQERNELAAKVERLQAEIISELKTHKMNGGYQPCKKYPTTGAPGDE